MAKKRRSSQFKDTSQVIDIEEARRKRQEKREKQQRRTAREQETSTQKRTVRASVRAGRRKKYIVYAVIILCIIAAIGVSILNIVSLKAEYKEAERQNQQLQEQKKELEQQIEDSKDKEYIEEEARKQLRMVKPGESVYIVPYAEQATEASEESEKE